MFSEFSDALKTAIYYAIATQEILYLVLGKPYLDTPCSLLYSYFIYIHIYDEID
jgi:hypothetical protein